MFSLTFLPYAKCRKCKLENILLGIIDNFINCISVHSMFRKKKKNILCTIYIYFEQLYYCRETAFRIAKEHKAKLQVKGMKR